MCRNIRVLHNFEPPSTEEEIHAASLQYVRKVSGVSKPSAVTQAAFEAAVSEVSAITAKLLSALPPREPHRTREGERERGRLRFARRFGTSAR